MEMLLSSNLKLACIAFFLLLISAPAVMGRVHTIFEPAEVRVEVIDKAIVQELAKEELMNAYFKQEVAAATRDSSHLKQVVEQNPLKKCNLVGLPCKQNSDCCFGLTCRYLADPFFNACSLI